jgi:hypothetical protein
MKSEDYRMDDLHWIDEKLYFCGKDTGMTVVPFVELYTQYRPEDKLFKVMWPDGVCSHDFYNFTRAREAAKKFVLEAPQEFI